MSLKEPGASSKENTVCRNNHGQTLVYRWNNAPQENFNFNFSGAFSYYWLNFHY